MHYTHTKESVRQSLHCEKCVQALIVTAVPSADNFPSLVVKWWEETQPTINKHALLTLTGPHVMNSTSKTHS